MSHEPPQRLWIAGTVQFAGNHSWSLKGVYTSEEKSKLVCRKVNDFYAPANIDDMSEDCEPEVFPGIVFPNRVKG